MKLVSENLLWNLLRLSLSFIFLWAFFDKLFGLGFSTAVDKSWLAGVSPTAGFLKFGATGILSSLFNSLSGNIIVDVLFMTGLFAVGLCMLLGIGIKIASFSGALMMFLIYLSLFPSKNNPLLDEHIVYILIFFLIGKRSLSQKFWLSDKWKSLDLVKKYPILQ